MSSTLIINAIALGIGLAMDAFSVSLANGLYYPQMQNSKRFSIAATFGIFQFIMPLIGWYLIHTTAETFKFIDKFIPWFGMILLLYIGLNMLIEGIKNNKSEKKEPLNFKTLMIQGIATSIDALSVGFTNSMFSFPIALTQALIIGIETFFICLGALYLGNKVGNRFQNKASILGGSILIIIALEILFTDIL